MKMLRKALYITPRNAAFLSRESARLGISESEVMRRLMDERDDGDK